ncbi:hypothetical protein [Collimonas silvisoli]|uniref:hypothetical protein n=1 Tax=Collimonas silvisoli TaxID=2825884 RepID=UPI001B8D13F4|nr:hypothetical protein [Collimonas silvisoli]
MNQHISLTLCNTVGATLSIVAFYSAVKVKAVTELNQALKIRPMLVPAGASDTSRSYNRTCIYFSIALAAYIVIAIGNDVEVDMDLAMTSLVILFAVTLARVWFLRRLLGKPCA